MSMIPNPKKNVVVDFTISEIKNSLLKIPAYFKQKYTLEKKNDLLNQFTFGALEFLSLGVHIDINLNYVSETRTEIIVEVRRKIGAFDQWVEVQKANEHISKLFDGISVLLTNTRALAAPVETDNPVQAVSYDLYWEDVKRHLNKLMIIYPNTYKLVSTNNLPDQIVLRRVPQEGDDVPLAIDAIINITKTSASENSCEIKFEITNESNKISTQGELKRNTVILKITINLVQKIIDEIKNKITVAEGSLASLKKWKIGRNESEKERQIADQLKIIEQLKEELKKTA